MNLEVKVEVFHKERITPSSPTPHHLTTFTISILDQFSPSLYFPLILFYPVNNQDASHNVDLQSLVLERTELLKRSLSETLTRFYPFAGRIQDHASVCCNDEGAMFLEAQVNTPMSTALQNPNLDFVKELIPDPQSGEADLLLVQANFFECGGIAIGVQITHKIADAFTLCTLLNNWSTISRGTQLVNDNKNPHIYVGAASRFPPLKIFKPDPTFMKITNERCTTKTFLFESSNINSLKSKAASAAVRNPTRVEVISALIWKCAMKASATNLGFTARPSTSVWLSVVNMRKILAQPSAENLMGNLLGFFRAIGRSENELRDLVGAMRRELDEVKVKYGANGIGADDSSVLLKEYREILHKDDVECFVSSSWCRLPFYEVDFGWGKPLMSSPGMVEIKNWMLLMDTSDGRGVTVRLSLGEEEMAVFESDEELLTYASVNSSLV